VALDISRAFRSPGDHFPFELQLALPSQDILGETVHFDPAIMQGVFYMADGKLYLDGTLTTVAHSRCSKCLDPAQYPVHVDFHEIFNDAREKVDTDEYLPDDMDRFAYDGPQLAVDHLALTLAILDLPIRFLCREDCLGISGIAGNNQEADADQKELKTQHPFSALQQLLNKDQEV